ncbi:MAG: hypothetical protein JJU40_02840 [Rhodobacteraceae bacterium]|nr:hypothetical protein [Paracoccaceae bacterium]
MALQLRLSEGFLETARARLNDTGSRSEANLRRVTSDLYYAVFHAVCEAVVEPFPASPENAAFKSTFNLLYRMLDHGQAERRCREIVKEKGFALGISRFAGHFVMLKNKRESADYDPLGIFDVGIVAEDLRITEARIADFWDSDPAERSAFAWHVAFKPRKEGAVRLS